MVLRRLKNKQGVALLLVISTIMFLTVIVTNFWSDALMSHQMAVNYRDRVKSYYLAKSAIRFSKLLLYYNEKLVDTLSQKKVSLTDIKFEPLYKKIPISTTQLRTVLTGMDSTADSSEDTETDTEEVVPDEASDTDSGDGSGVEDFMESSQQGLSLLKRDSLDEFLKFDGDFDVLISEEQAKYALNAITKITPSSASYDLYKKILLSVLLKPSFKNFFENQERDAEKLVHALADFVDSNSVINDFDKVERGSEDSIYKDIKYKVKSAPFITLSELRLVAGMNDDILEALRPLVTVYSSSDKINVCLADEELVNALIVHYTRYAECTNPIDADDKDQLDKLRDEMLGYCPDKSSVASALNVALGIKQPATNTEDTPSTAETKATESQVAECKIQFENLISDDNNIFNIQATGTVNGVRTVISEVLEVTGTKTSAWKTYYYQIN